MWRWSGCLESGVVLGEGCLDDVVGIRGLLGKERAEEEKRRFC